MDTNSINKPKKNELFQNRFLGYIKILLKKYIIKEKNEDDVLNKFLSCYSWEEIKSSHFIIKYVPQNTIDFEEIKKYLEESYESIKKIINITEQPIFVIFLVPDKLFCLENHLIPRNSAVPINGFAIILMSDTMEKIKKCIYHELVHLIVYYWDYEIYHLEILEEGLSHYLCYQEKDHHKEYLNIIEIGILTKQAHDLMLYSSSYINTVDYSKAASFVKYLIDKYGMNKFKYIFVESKLEVKGDRYYVKGEILPLNYLYTLLKRIYGKNPIEMQLEWINEIAVHTRKT